MVWSVIIIWRVLKYYKTALKAQLTKFIKKNENMQIHMAGYLALFQDVRSYFLRNRSVYPISE